MPFKFSLSTFSYLLSFFIDYIFAKILYVISLKFIMCIVLHRKDIFCFFHNYMKLILLKNIFKYMYFLLLDTTY